MDTNKIYSHLIKEGCVFQKKLIHHPVTHYSTLKNIINYEFVSFQFSKNDGYAQT